MKCNVTRQSATWLQQADLISALCETSAWLQAKYTNCCFEMLSWPHRTSANIIDVCFWLLETCTKCSCFIDRGKHKTRRSTVGIWSEVRVYRTPATNIPWGGGLRLGKFPDNRRSMCYTAVQRKSKLCRTKPSTGPQVGIADLVISLSTVY